MVPEVVGDVVTGVVVAAIPVTKQNKHVVNITFEIFKYLQLFVVVTAVPENSVKTKVINGCYFFPINIRIHLRRLM